MTSTSTIRSRSAVSAADWPPGFLKLYHDNYGHMVRLARMLTGRDDVAEELVQDCYLRIARRWDDLDQPAAYLRRAVVNATRSWHRTQVRLRPMTAADDLATTDPEVDETWRELRRLTAKRRTAIVLRYWEGLDDASIAEVMGCKPATVRSLIHRAHKQLEEVLR